MRVNFFDDPLEGPRPREEVRLKKLGLYVHEGGRRVSVGFEITPFLEKPSVEVRMVNSMGELAGSLNVIHTHERNFSLIMHLRDKTPTEKYEVTAVLYYLAEPGDPRQEVHTLKASFGVTRPGDQTIASSNYSD
jgi:hypothetical protein